MPTELYLDTARLGRMGLRAQRAHRDFLRLCGDEGGSAHVEDLLRLGTDAWPDSLRRRYPALADWEGVDGLKRSLRALTGTGPETEVLLAQRSAQLMRLAARALFRRCRRVLHTDLEWPGYLRILEAEGDADRARRGLPAGPRGDLPRSDLGRGTGGACGGPLPPAGLRRPVPERGELRGGPVPASGARSSSASRSAGPPGSSRSTGPRPSGMPRSISIHATSTWPAATSGSGPAFPWGWRSAPGQTPGACSGCSARR